MGSSWSTVSQYSIPAFKRRCGVCNKELTTRSETRDYAVLAPLFASCRGDLSDAMAATLASELAKIQYEYTPPATPFCLEHTCEKKDCHNGVCGDEGCHKCVEHRCMSRGCNVEPVAGAHACARHACSVPECKEAVLNDAHTLCWAWHACTVSFPDTNAPLNAGADYRQCPRARAKGEAICTVHAADLM